MKVYKYFNNNLENFVESIIHNKNIINLKKIL